jgi:hypothetical protein
MAYLPVGRSTGIVNRVPVACKRRSDRRGPFRSNGAPGRGIEGWSPRNAALTEEFKIRSRSCAFALALALAAAPLSESLAAGGGTSGGSAAGASGGGASGGAMGGAGMGAGAGGSGSATGTGSGTGR